MLVKFVIKMYELGRYTLEEAKAILTKFDMINLVEEVEGKLIEKP